MLANICQIKLIRLTGEICKYKRISNINVVLHSSSWKYPHQKPFEVIWHHFLKTFVSMCVLINILISIVMRLKTISGHILVAVFFLKKHLQQCYPTARNG